MFKKEITYFILYHLKGNSNSKFTVYVTNTICTSSASIFHEKFIEQCINTHKLNCGYEPSVNELSIESIQMISFQISIFGKRIF